MEKQRWNWKVQEFSDNKNYNQLMTSHEFLLVLWAKSDERLLLLNKFIIIMIAEFINNKIAVINRGIYR